MALKRVLIGKCGVDSGRLLIADPAYIKYMKSLHDDKSWSNYCNQIDRNDVDVGSTPEVINSLAVDFFTGHGDGMYKVYGHMNGEGRIIKVTIDLENMI